MPSERLLDLERREWLLSDPSDLKIPPKSDIRNTRPKRLFGNFAGLFFHPSEPLDLIGAISGKEQENVGTVKQSRAELILK